MKFTQSITAKALIIGVLALLMLIPLSQVSELIHERNDAREGAIRSISAGWGGEQIVGGPVLIIPSRETGKNSANEPYVIEHSEAILPDTLSISSTLKVEMRHYGIYDVPLYVSTLRMTGNFLRADIEKFMQSNGLQWSPGKGQLLISMSDLTGLRSIESKGSDALNGTFVSTDQKIAGDLSAVALPVDASVAGDIPFNIEVTLAGSQSLSFVPLARKTDVMVAAPWANPSFTGMALPIARQIDATQFQASWKLLDLNRGFGQHWTATGPAGAANTSWPAISATQFGVTLYQPVNIYQQNERAGKYGILFIALTFVAFFMFELLKERRLHPMQYLLVGVGLATFYLVLLALSEQLGFTIAYIAAACAIILMVGGYGAAILRARSSGLLLGGMLALVYGFLYALIIAEQYSLLVGSLALLLVVAALMYLTRNVDWFRYSATLESAAKPQVWPQSGEGKAP